MGKIRLLAFVAGVLCALPLLAGEPYLVANLNENLAPYGSSASNFTSFGALAFFTTGVHGYDSTLELWRTDGTEAGTFALRAGGSEKVLWNGKLWFLGNSAGELYSTDGTLAGTQRLTLPVTTPALAPSTLMAGPGHLYFFHDKRLWRTDGTTDGTTEVAATTFVKGPGVGVKSGWATVGSSLFFVADANNDSTWELWRVEGSTLSVVVEGGYIDTLLAANGVLFCIRYDHTAALPPTLWRSDGTAAGTFALHATNAAFGSGLLTDGTVVWFSGNDPADGNKPKLWRTDGTLAGTVGVASSLPGASAVFDAAPLGRLPNGTLLFQGPAVPANSSQWGVWALDGNTTDGTTMTFLANLSHGNSARKVALAGGVAIFGSGDELWRSDGTVGGTFRLIPIYGSNGTIHWEMASAGAMVVFSGDDSEHGFEPWKTDGTVEGTALIADLNAATYPSSPRELVAFRGGVLFRASTDDTTGSEFDGTRTLWFSDGTEAGTEELVGGYMSKPVVCGLRAIFSRGTSTEGHEPWITDGTTAGTMLLKDILPGTPSGGANAFTCVDGIAFFFAQGQLWRSDGTPDGTMAVGGLMLGDVKGRPVAWNHHLYFVMGSSILRSDGTAAGTGGFHAFHSGESPNGHFIPSGPFLYFTTTAPGPFPDTLWRTDGTAGETTRVLSAAGIAMQADFYGRLAFRWTSNNNSPGYCTTDGIAGGTNCFDPQVSSASGFRMQPHNGDLYYNKPDLFRTNGTWSGTTGVEDVELLHTSAGGRLYLTAGPYRHFLESDGTLAGTRTLTTDLYVAEAVASGGRLFLGADELYAYDLEVTPTSFAPKSVDSAGGQAVTISGRGFAAPVTVRIDGVAVLASSVTAISIVFTAPARDPGTYPVDLAMGDGRRILLDEPLTYTCSAPVAVAQADPAFTCAFTPVTLQGSGGTRCAWFPAAGLDDPSSCTPQASVGTTTTYSLIVFNANGCPSTNHATATVNVRPAVDPTISIDGKPSYQLLRGGSSHTASVADAGVGATYAWSGTGVTFTSSTSARTATFTVACIDDPALHVVVTTAEGCVFTADRSGARSGVVFSGFLPRIANANTLITVAGAGLACVQEVRLLRVGQTTNYVSPPFTLVNESTITFRNPGNVPSAAHVELWSADGKAFLPSTPSTNWLRRSARGDVNDSAISDIFWRNSATGENSIWIMAGTAFGGYVTPSAPAGWSPAVFGDFNGDARSDVFWRNPTTGETSIWLMYGPTPSTSARTLTLPLAWLPMGSGDFDGDGKYDLFWQNVQTGETSIWFMNGTTFTGVRSLTVPTAWRPVGFGDFDADGKGDIFWRNKTTGETSVWLMNGTYPSLTVRSDTFSTQWSVAGVGDFDTDRRDDLFWRNGTTGETAVWFMNGVAIASKRSSLLVPPPWKVAAVGDFNGISAYDIFWHNPSTGETSIWFMSGAMPYEAVRSYTVTNTNWRPMP